MSHFPRVETELKELKRSLAELPPAKGAKKDEIDDVRAAAERLIFRLTNPVRVAILGLPGSGKSTLAAFLSGEGRVAQASDSRKPVPVIMTHADDPAAVAGWWDGKQKIHPGLDFRSAQGDKPDYLEIRLSNPILTEMSFLDMPGLDDPVARVEQMKWIASRADVVIWCTPLQSAWSDDEQRLWSLAPARLHSKGLLAVTKTDDPGAAVRRASILAQLKVEAASNFANMVPIATTLAAAAAPMGQVSDAKAWDENGGRALVVGLLTLVRSVRESQSAATRLLIDTRIAGLQKSPAAHRTTAASAPRAASAPAAIATPAATPAASLATTGDAAPVGGGIAARLSELGRLRPAASAAAGLADQARPSPEGDLADTGPDMAMPEPDAVPDTVQAADAPPDPRPESSGEAPQADRSEPNGEAQPASDDTAGADAQEPIREFLAGEFDELIALTKTGPSVKDWQFMAKVADIADELSVIAGSKGQMVGDGEWVRLQIEEAYIALTLLQMEPSDQTCIDAATILLQLSRDMAWAVAPLEKA